MGTDAEQTRRLGRVRAAMAAAGIDGLLAFAPGWRRENVRYLTDARVRGSFALAYLPASGDLAAFGIPGGREAFDGGWAEDVRPLDLPR